MEKKKWWKIGTLIAIAVLVFAIDIIAKYIIDAKIESGSEVRVIPYVIDFTNVHNYGAAWGMLSGKQAFLIFLTVLFIAVFIWYYIKEKNKTWLLTISFGLLLAGCFGNLFDRVFFGYVRDFLMFDFWKAFPVFNFADVALFVGVILFVIYLSLYFAKKGKDKKKEKEEEKDA